MSTMFSIVENSSRKYPNKTALVYKENKYTYSELMKKIDVVRSFFINNTSNQDKVFLLMENSDSWVISYFGIMGAGCICAPLGVRTSDSNILFQLKFAQPKYIVISSKFKDKCERLELDKIAKVIVYDEIIDNHDKIDNSNENIRNNESSVHKREVELTEDSYNSLIYTSGTKGIQKAILLKHKIVYNSTKNIIDYLKIRHDDIYYQILPLSHSFGLGNVHTTLYMGGTVIIADNTINLKKIINEMVENKVTFFAAVPLTLKLMVENFFEDFKRLDEHLRTICTNTGPMPTDITHRIITETKNIQFYTYYGLTEASRSSFMYFNLYPDKLKSVGKPTPNVNIKLLNHNGEIITKANEVGEICIIGNHTVKGYWNNEEATNKSFKQGWLHTGDMGYFDNEGFLFVTGRDDDIVNMGGEKVSLQEIDNVISKCALVKDVMCLEQKDYEREFVINAHVVLDDDKLNNNQEEKLSEEEIKRIILEHCKQSLDNFKIPNKILYCETLPRTDSGKTKRAFFRNQMNKENEEFKDEERFKKNEVINKGDINGK
ncbi:acyl--CoA ligase [Candidatus Woesearchaeota archaeon]|jgi:long-chain acyl-CoA synthetase|nr:acyl--CoA ligase [Candidatus Woesearchaeota archaeon]